MNNLKKLRQDREIKQIELADTIGVGQATLSGWETGRYQIDDNSLFKLADFFNVTTDYLLGRTDDPSPPSAVVQDEVWDLREHLRRDPERRMLFDAAKNVRKADIETAVRILDAFRNGEENAD